MTTTTSVADLIEVSGPAVEEVSAGQRALRDTFGCFPSGVIAVCADLGEGRQVGMAVSSFTSVSLTPALVSVCIDLASTTWAQLREAPRLGASVLAAEHNLVARQLASRSGDRFRDLPVESTGDGALFVQGAAAWFDCSIEAEVEAGDHLIVMLRVHRHHARADVPPLVFHRSTFSSLASTP